MLRLLFIHSLIFCHFLGGFKGVLLESVRSRVHTTWISKASSCCAVRPMLLRSSVELLVRQDSWPGRIPSGLLCGPKHKMQKSLDSDSDVRSAWRFSSCVENLLRALLPARYDGVKQASFQQYFTAGVGVILAKGLPLQSLYVPLWVCVGSLHRPPTFETHQRQTQ